jgi:hypothetical protein
MITFLSILNVLSKAGSDGTSQSKCLLLAAIVLEDLTPLIHSLEYELGRAGNMHESGSSRGASQQVFLALVQIRQVEIEAHSTNSIMII